MFGGIKYQPKKESTLQHFALNMEEERLSSKPQFSNMPKLSYTPKKAPDIKEMDKGTPEGIQLSSKPVSSGRNAKKLYDERREKYLSASDIVVNADGSVNRVAREIADCFK